MISDYLVMHPSGPFFTLNEKEYKEALKLSPKLADDVDGVTGQFVAGQFVADNSLRTIRCKDNSLQDNSLQDNSSQGQFVAWTIRCRTIRCMDNSLQDNSFAR